MGWLTEVPEHSEQELLSSGERKGDGVMQWGDTPDAERGGQEEPFVLQKQKRKKTKEETRSKLIGFSGNNQETGGNEPLRGAGDTG